MKTHLLKVATLCTMAAFLGACDKDSTTPKENDEIVMQDNHPIERLKTFHRQIEAVKTHPSMRSSETTTVTDALWEVENYFNMTYSDPEQYYTSTSDHEFTLTLPVNNDQQVLVNDAVELYSQVIEEARASLISDMYENKGVVSLAIKETEASNDGLAITFIEKNGERCAHNPNPYINSVEGPFTMDDNWMFAAPLGKCDDPDIPSGADKQLQEKLYDLLIESIPDAQPGHRSIYVNRKRIVFDGKIYPRIYYSCNPEEQCIHYPSMNNYFQGEKKAVSETIPEQYHLNGYQLISIEIHGATVDDDAYTTHVTEVEYGIPYQVRIDEFGEVEDLLQP